MTVAATNREPIFSVAVEVCLLCLSRAAQRCPHSQLTSNGQFADLPLAAFMRAQVAPLDSYRPTPLTVESSIRDSIHVTFAIRQPRRGPQARGLVQSISVRREPMSRAFGMRPRSLMAW